MLQYRRLKHGVNQVNIIMYFLFNYLLAEFYGLNYFVFLTNKITFLSNVYSLKKMSLMDHVIMLAHLIMHKIENPCYNFEPSSFFSFFSCTGIMRISYSLLSYFSFFHPQKFFYLLFETSIFLLKLWYCSISRFLIRSSPFHALFFFAVSWFLSSWQSWRHRGTQWGNFWPIMCFFDEIKHNDD